MQRLAKQLNEPYPIEQSSRPKRAQSVSLQRSGGLSAKVFPQKSGARTPIPAQTPFAGEHIIL